MTNMTLLRDAVDPLDVFDEADTDDITPALDDRDGQVANGGDLALRMGAPLLVAEAGKPVTEAGIKAGIIKGYGSRNWDQLCQAFARDTCALFGHGNVGYASANAARAASKIKSKTAGSAPTASFHYWRIGAFGHVAVGLGGSRVAMASKYIDTKWTPAVALGVTTVSRYTARTGAVYLGWSLTNGANDFTMVELSNEAADRRAEVKRLAKHLNGLHLGKTTTAVDDGVPGGVYWWLVQIAGHGDGSYPKTSPADGKPGTLTVKSEAHQLKALK